MLVEQCHSMDISFSVDIKTENGRAAGREWRRDRRSGRREAGGPAGETLKQ